MSAARVRFIGAARTEFRLAVDYYNTQVTGLGSEFAAEVEHAINKIGVHPRLGTPYLSGTRRVVVRRFPFNIVYRVRGGQVVIVAIAHQRRRQGYWEDRL